MSLEWRQAGLVGFAFCNSNYGGGGVGKVPSDLVEQLACSVWWIPMTTLSFKHDWLVGR